MPNLLLAFGPRDCIVRAYRVHDPNPKAVQVRVELYSLSRGRAVWQCEVDADVTSMVTTADARHIIFALNNGRLGMIDALDGRLIHDERLTADGVPTVATALAILDQRVVVGTIDGRLLLYTLDG